MIREPTVTPLRIDQLAVGFVGKHHLRDARHGQRIQQAQQDRRHEGHQGCDEKVPSDIHVTRSFDVRHHARPSAVMITSMILIPMNGAISPPTP